MDRRDKEEEVLVIPKEMIWELGYFQGISFDLDKYLPVVLNPDNWLFIERNVAEFHTEYKQLIPYVICIFDERVFSYRRNMKQSDPRLRALYSIGLGGHIKKTDNDFSSYTYQLGLEREINEEVNISCDYHDSVIGMINDDSNHVGKVHIGIIHLFSLEKQCIKPLKETMLEAKFLRKAHLIKKINLFENWSKICIGNFDKIIT